MKPEGGMLLRVRLSELLGLIRRIFTPQCNAAKHTANRLHAECGAVILAPLPAAQLAARLPDHAAQQRHLTLQLFDSQTCPATIGPTDKEPNV